MLSVTSTYTSAAATDKLSADAFTDVTNALDTVAATPGAAASTTNYLSWVD